MDDKTSYSWGGIGFLALFFLIIAAFFFRGGNGFGWGSNGSGFATGALLGADMTGLTNSGYQNYKATCDAEKAQMADTARTQYLTEQQASQTRELINSTANATQARIDFYAMQGLRDALNERDRTISELKNQIFVKEQLAPISSQLQNIRCNMLVRPEVTGIGAVSPNAAIINGLGLTNGFNGWNGWNGCGCGSTATLV